MTKPNLFWALLLGVALGVSAAPVLAQEDVDPGGSTPENPGPDTGRDDAPSDEDDVGDVGDSDPGGTSATADDPSDPVDDRDPGSSGSGLESDSGMGPFVDDSDDDGAVEIPEVVNDGDGNWLAKLFSGRDG